MGSFADLLLASSSDAIAIISCAPDGPIRAISQGLRRHLGSETAGKSLMEIMPPGDGERILGLLDRIPSIPPGRVPLIPVRLRRQNGEYWPAAAELLSHLDGLQMMVRLHDRSISPYTPLATLMHHTLHQAIATSQRQNQATSQLLSLISHEFRTPLNAILGFTELSLLRLNDTASDINGSADPFEELRTLLHQIDLVGCDLNNTVNGFMTVATLDNPNYRAVGCDVIPLHLLEQVANGLRDLVAEKRISLRVRDFCLRPVIRVDLDSAVQALNHLAHNAVKFAPPDSIVRLICQDEGPNVALIVTDRGPGLPPALAHALATGDLPFDGVGLSTVQAIANLQGGSLSLTPRPNGGTRAILRLPATGLDLAGLDRAGNDQ